MVTGASFADARRWLLAPTITAARGPTTLQVWYVLILRLLWSAVIFMGLAEIHVREG